MSSGNRSLTDQKCSVCGTWMKTSRGKNESGTEYITYSCPECGLSYRADA